VLLSADLRAGLADLGMAKIVGSQAISAAGMTSTHAAPEQLMGQRCTTAADMYSFGVLLIELTTQRVGQQRFHWQLPRVPNDCPQVRWCMCRRRGWLLWQCCVLGSGIG